nr:hypothetical protein [Streptomyces sp. MH191]
MGRRSGALRRLVPGLTVLLGPPRGCRSRSRSRSRSRNRSRARDRGRGRRRGSTVTGLLRPRGRFGGCTLLQSVLERGRGEPHGRAAPETSTGLGLAGLGDDASGVRTAGVRASGVRASGVRASGVCVPGLLRLWRRGRRRPHGETVPGGDVRGVGGVTGGRHRGSGLSGGRGRRGRGGGHRRHGRTRHGSRRRRGRRGGRRHGSRGRDRHRRGRGRRRGRHPGTGGGHSGGHSGSRSRSRVRALGRRAHRRTGVVPVGLRGLLRCARGVLRVPGGRRVVDGELARHLDGGLGVGLVVVGCGPAPAEPVPIAVHNSSWCGRASSCVPCWGQPLSLCELCEVVRLRPTLSDVVRIRPVHPLAGRRPATLPVSRPVPA